MDARDIEYGLQDNKVRVHKYIDSSDTLELADTTSQGSEPGDTLKRDKLDIFTETSKDQQNDKLEFSRDQESPDEGQLGENGFSHQTCSPRDTPSEIELQDMTDPVYAAIGMHSVRSDDSTLSTTSDAAPLVSTEPSGKDSTSSGFIRRGLYKKNAPHASQSGTSTRSASAKSSKRVSKQSS
jgi:hypothetical protein